MKPIRTIFVLLITLFAALSGTVFAASTADSDKIFDWAERSFSSLLYPPAVSATYGEYYYRYYSGTKSYVAVKGARVLYATGGTTNIVDVGDVAGFLAQANAAATTFALTSTAFAEGQAIPTQHACSDLRGKDMSPPLAWTAAPGGTKSFALIVEDPDAPAGIWTHWIVYNMSADTTSLTEGYPLGASQANGVMQALSDWSIAGYGGMCPPSGTHRYYFKLYALSSTITLPASATRADFLGAINGKVLGQASLMGKYSAQ